MKDNKKKKIILLAIAADVVILILILWIFGFYPVVLVGNDFISNRELEKSILIAKKFDPTPDKAKVKQQLVESNQSEQVVKKLKLYLDPEGERSYFKKGREDQYNKFINDYFFSDEKYLDRFLLKPQTIDAALRIKYNSNFGANNNAYNIAQNLINRLNKGEAFEELAKTYSDEIQSGQLGGDIGFVKTGEILPELEKIIVTAKLGEVKKEIVVSRMGYHILFPIETAQKDGEKVWHIKHILILTSGYEDWLSEQLKQIRVWNIF